MSAGHPMEACTAERAPAADMIRGQLGEQVEYLTQIEGVLQEVKDSLLGAAPPSLNDECEKDSPSGFLAATTCCLRGSNERLRIIMSDLAEIRRDV